MAERFQKIKDIGSGAFARTLLVEDSDNGGVRVAIKVPHDRAKEEALIQEMVNNAALSAVLGKAKHPNIVRFLGIGQYQKTRVMVMEYVAGGNLRRRMEKPLDISHSLRIYRDCLLGLMVAHSIDLFHRDIKPENILLDQPTGSAKLADFGVGKIVHSLQQSGTSTGTFPYMAPEAFRNVGANGHLDLWSLHVTLYELLTGRLPFLASSIDEQMRMIRQDHPLPPSQINTKVPAKLEKHLLKGLEKDPKKRHASAEDTLVSLFRFAPELRTQEVPEVRSKAEEVVAAARRAYQNGHEREAEAMLEKALQESSDEIGILIALSELWNRRYQFSHSERLLRRNIEQGMREPEVHYQMAVSLEQLHRIEEAADFMRQALEMGLPEKKRHDAERRLKTWRKS